MIPMNKKTLGLPGLTLALLLTMAGSAAAHDFAIILKSGSIRLADDNQRLDGTTREFDDNSKRTLALAWEIRNSHRVGLGMEYITFEHEFTPANDGYTKSRIYLFSARKYFKPTKAVLPFAGIGLGWGFAKYDDGVGKVDRDWNPTLQISAGVEFQVAEEFGIYLEAKGLASNTDGERENEFDFTSSGLMAGVSLIF